MVKISYLKLCHRFFFGLLLLIDRISANNSTARCPLACGNTCHFNWQGEIISAKCKDVKIEGLPNTLETLHVYDVRDPLKVPLGRFTDFILMGKENLTSLKIENYQLTTLDPKCFQNLTKLERLDLSRNNIQILVEDSFTGLKNLKYLNLNENSLSKLKPNLFRQLPSLVELYISVNKLSTIGEEDFAGLDNVKKIVLQNNQISTVHRDAFNFLSTLEDVNLQENHLTTIERGVFSNMPNLTSINLQQNDISNLDSESMDGTTNLQMLKLAENHLSSFPTELLQKIGNSNLIVNIARNDITELLDKAFDNVAARGLSLNSNNISQIAGNAFENNDIQMLDLRDNTLNHIPEDIIKDVQPPMKILLTNNPWSCDCEIQPIVNIMQITGEEFFCDSPGNYSGWPILNVTQELNETCTWKEEDDLVFKGDDSVDVRIIVGSVLGGMTLLAGLAALILKCCGFITRKVTPTDEEKETSGRKISSNSVISTVNLT